MSTIYLAILAQYLTDGRTDILRQHSRLQDAIRTIRTLFSDNVRTIYVYVILPYVDLISH